MGYKGMDRCEGYGFQGIIFQETDQLVENLSLARETGNCHSKM